MAELSKLQIRAIVLSVISEIKSNKSYNLQLLEKLKDELSQIEDRSALFDIIIKEFIKLEEDEYTFTALLIKELIDKDYIEKQIYSFLESKSYTDEAKYRLVQLLRISGNRETYDTIPQYFDNPEEIMDKETQNLLEKAAYNPESMLDFLDFIYTVQKRDKELLITSLNIDYKGDNLANIVYPILYSDFEDDFKLSIIDVLTDSKSSIGLEPLNFLIETSENTKLVNSAQKALKELKLAGATQEKANKFFKEMIKESAPSCAFTTIPDGEGNQAIMLTRAKEDNTVIFIAIVLNDIKGIIDCFGFYNISVEESCRIIAKFYKCEGKYKITPEYAKTKINTAIKKTIELKRLFPYEFICWNVFLKDINEYKYSINDLIKQVKINKNFSLENICELLTEEYTIRWFIDIENNKKAQNLFEIIYNQNEYDITEINQLIKEHVGFIFDNDEINLWKTRLKELIHLLDINNKEKEAAIFLSLLKKESYFNTFKQILVQRTIFNSTIRIKQNIKARNNTTDIFSQKTKIDEKYELNRLNRLIKELQKNWING